MANSPYGYYLPDDSLQRVRMKLDQMKLAGKTVSPMEVRSLYQAEMDALAGTAQKERAMDIQTTQFEKNYNLQREQNQNTRDIAMNAGNQAVISGYVQPAATLGSAALLGKAYTGKFPWQSTPGTQDFATGQSIPSNYTLGTPTAPSISGGTDMLGPRYSPISNPSTYQPGPQPAAADGGITTSTGNTGSPSMAPYVQDSTSALYPSTGGGTAIGAAGTASDVSGLTLSGVDAGEVGMGTAATAGSYVPYIGPALTAANIGYKLATGDTQGAINDTPIVGGLAGSERAYEQGNWGSGTTQLAGASFGINRIPGGQNAMEQVGNKLQSTVEGAGKAVGNVVSEATGGSCTLYTYFYGPYSKQVRYARIYCFRHMDEPTLLGYYRTASFLKHISIHYGMKKPVHKGTAAFYNYILWKIGRSEKVGIGTRLWAKFLLTTFRIVHKIATDYRIPTYECINAIRSRDRGC
jgi:hypothetical protein